MQPRTTLSPTPFTPLDATAAGAWSDTDTPGLFAFLSRFAVALVLGFLAISTFEGPLRFYAAQAGLPWIVYAKDVLLIGALVLGLVNTFVRDVRNLPLAVTLLFLVGGTVIGLATLADYRQPLFAAKTWLPLLCGTVIATSLYGNLPFVYRASWFLWLAAVAGIFYTAFQRAPWEGFTYEVGGMAVEASREWTIGDIKRAGGFSRASFDAALQCLFAAILVVSLTRSRFVQLVTWLVSAAAIYLTISRSALLALAVALVFYLLTIALRPAQRLAKLAIIFLALGVGILPFAASHYYKDIAGTAETVDVSSTSSLEERALSTWPKGLALPDRGGTWYAGRGLGGIGVGQQYFETEIFNPGDNFFVYLFGAFGACGALFLAFLPLQVWRAPIPFTPLRRAALLIVAAFLAVGFTLNAIEASVASLFLGIGLVWLTAHETSEHTEALSSR